MDAPITLWEKWHEQVKEVLPDLHGYQQKTRALFVLGIVVSGCAVLQRVAEELSLRGSNAAKMTSIERRLARFLANEPIVVRDVWKQFVRQVLPFWGGQKLWFVLDRTPFNEDATIVSMGWWVHSRLLPLAWCVMAGQDKWSEGQWPIVARLLDQSIPYLGEADCTLIAARGLVGLPLVQLCRDRKWHDLVRVCNTNVRSVVHH